MRIIVFFVLVLGACFSIAEDNEDRKIAVFAGGCFWCMEPPFDKLEGVLATTSGYIGGSAESAEYKKVSRGGTGHVEAVQIEYDPKQVSFDRLLEVYWRNVDPFDDKGQFCDKGAHYLSYIYYQDEHQKTRAELSFKKEQAAFAQPFATRIVKAGSFYPAESRHQNYYQRNPIRYKFYRTGCGRDKRLKAIWGEPK